LSHFISFVRIPALAIRQHVWPLPPLDVLGEDVLKLRVLPNDIDTNFHLNNGRYLNLMDYARTHMLARTRILEHIIRVRYQPLVGAVWMTYRRYMEQIFAGSKGLAAIGWVKGILRDAQGNVPPQKVIDAVSPGRLSPPMPEAMVEWNELTKEKLAGGE